MYIMDYHHHTNHSFDSKASMEEVCKSAIDKGIKELCFTEHFSVNPLAPTYGHIDFNKYFNEIESCNDKFKNKLVIKAGIELCEPHLLMEEYDRTLKPLNLDLILGSIHNINNQKLRKYLEDKDRTTAYRGYFNEVYKMVSLADIDVIAHIDLLKRYCFNTLGVYDFKEYKDILEIILKKAIERNIGIEINTSGLRGSLNQAFPTLNVIQLYKNLGGEILTIGSDSHHANTVGSNLDEAIAMLKECDFNYIFKYENRNPIAVEL